MYIYTSERQLPQLPKAAGTQNIVIEATHCLGYVSVNTTPCGKVRETRACAAVFRGNPRNCGITRKIAPFCARIRVPAKGRDKTKSRGISCDKYLTLPLP